MKKSYKLARYEQGDSGFALLLDGAAAHTPAGNPLIMPNPALADAVMQEWQSQGEVMRKGTMPLTQIVIIAIDFLADEEKRAVMSEQVLAYAETDLVCYRAGDSPALAALQAELLDPVMAWAEDRFGIALKITDGVMPVLQPAQNRVKLAEALIECDAWTLAALATAVGPLGSLVIALAFTFGHIDATTAYRLSHLEEDYETERWGKDEEKEKRLQGLHREITSVGEFLALLLSSKN